MRQQSIRKKNYIIALLYESILHRFTPNNAAKIRDMPLLLILNIRIQKIDISTSVNAPGACAERKIVTICLSVQDHIALVKFQLNRQYHVRHFPTRALALLRANLMNFAPFHTIMKTLAPLLRANLMNFAPFLTKVCLILI